MRCFTDSQFKSSNTGVMWQDLWHLLEVLKPTASSVKSNIEGLHLPQAPIINNKIFFPHFVIKNPIKFKVFAPRGIEHKTSTLNFCISNYQIKHLHLTAYGLVTLWSRRPGTCMLKASEFAQKQRWPRGGHKGLEEAASKVPTQARQVKQPWRLMIWKLGGNIGC